MSSHRVRPAQWHDLDRLAAFEVQIASISFGQDAVVDPAIHRDRLAAALAANPSGMLVAVDPDDQVVGWIWFSARENFVTGARYASFRSLAIADVLDRDAVTAQLFEAALAWAAAEGLAEITGHVHVDNAPMRLLYRRYGFTPTRLTLRRRLT